MGKVASAKGDSDMGWRLPVPPEKHEISFPGPFPPLEATSGAKLLEAIAREQGTLLGEDQLGEPGTVEPEGGAPTPQIRRAEKAMDAVPERDNRAANRMKAAGRRPPPTAIR